MAFIILDRDGVINYDSVEYIKSPEEWQAIPGSLEAIAKLNQHNFQVLVATNQSGVARGYYDLITLNRIHEKMFNELLKRGGHIQEIFYCPHHPQDNCPCRKPKPGLIHQMQSKYALNPAETYFIGDSLVDVQAANAVGCKPLLVATGKSKINNRPHDEAYNVPIFRDLAQAVDYVLFGTKEIDD